MKVRALRVYRKPLWAFFELGVHGGGGSTGSLPLWAVFELGEHGGGSAVSILVYVRAPLIDRQIM